MLNLKFTTHALFGLTFLIACAMTIVAYEQYWLFGVLLTVLIMNLIGALVAVSITKVFGFPTDGGYRDPAIRNADQRPQSLGPAASHEPGADD